MAPDLLSPISMREVEELGGPVCAGEPSLSAVLRQRLQEERRIAGYTRGELADAIGCSEERLAEVELGLEQADHLLLAAIADELGVPVGALFDPDYDLELALARHNDPLVAHTLDLIEDLSWAELGAQA